MNNENPLPFLSEPENETKIVYFSALKKAVVNKEYKLISAFLDIGMKLTHSQQIETLKNAIEDKSLKYIQELLPFCTFDLSFDNSILLHIACTRGYIEIAEFFLQNGIILHVSILENVVKKGQYDIVRLLVKYGASLTEGNALSYLYTYCENSLDENYQKIFDYVHSWGEFYKTARLCDGYGENEKKRFTIFQALDKAKTHGEIREIVKPLTQDEINWFNSPCLDGIAYSIVSFNSADFQEIFEDLLQNGYIDTCKFYMNKGILYGLNINSAFNFVCRIGRIEAVKFLLQKGANMNTYHNLQTVCNNNHIEIVKLFIEKGIEKDEKALSQSCEYGHYEIVKLLIDYGLSIHYNDDLALRGASKNGHYEIVKLLLETGADLHVGNEYALHLASERGHISVVKLLLENGANPNISSNGVYPLYRACENNHYKVVELLLEYKADIHANRDEALFIACKNNRYEIAKLLLKNGANPNFSGLEAMEVACKNRYMEILKLLIEQSLPQLDFRTKSMWCAIAARHGQFEMVKLLVENGADIHVNENGILRDTCKSGHVEIAKFLIEKGADVHSAGDYNLREACYIGRFEIAELLIKNGANVNAENDESLLAASSNGHTEIVKLLIENGADMLKYGNDAFYQAQYNRRIDTANLLKQYLPKPKGPEDF